MNAISILGIIFIPISIILLFLPIKYTIALVIISTVFQAASVITVGGNSISPLLYSCAALVFKQCLDWLVAGKITKYKIKWFKYYVAFLIAIVLITLFSPTLFGDVPVIVSTRPITYSPLYVVARNNSLSNIITLIAYGLALYIISIHKKEIENREVFRWFRFLLTIVLIVGFAQFVCKKMGVLYEFWKSLIYSKTDTVSIEAFYFNVEPRFIATFMEASYCGGFIAPALIAIFVAFGMRTKTFPVIIALIAAVLLNQSSTGLVIVGLSFLVYYLVSRNVNTKILFPIVGAVGVGALVIFGYGNTLSERILTKGSTSSGIQRSAMNASCISTLWNTHLLGAGLNNIRGSSFIFSILGQVGVVGLGLFIAFLISLMREQKPNRIFNPSEDDDICYRKFSIIFLLCVLLGMCLSEPDLFLSTFWLAMMMVALTNKSKESFYSNGMYEESNQTTF